MKFCKELQILKTIIILQINFIEFRSYYKFISIKLIILQIRSGKNLYVIFKKYIKNNKFMEIDLFKNKKDLKVEKIMNLYILV